jgi:hypothetical protein
MRFPDGDARDHIVSSKIDHGPVVAMKSDAAAEKSKDQLWRDFQGCSIFDFCNKICHERTWVLYSTTLSALASSVGVAASPSALAVLRLIDNSGYSCI